MLTITTNIPHLFSSLYIRKWSSAVSINFICYIFKRYFLIIHNYQSTYLRYDSLLVKDFLFR